MRRRTQVVGEVANEMLVLGSFADVAIFDWVLIW